MQDDDADALENAIDEALKSKGNLFIQNNSEEKAQEQTKIALEAADDSSNRQNNNELTNQNEMASDFFLQEQLGRLNLDMGQSNDNVSDGAVNGDQYDNQQNPADLKEIMGEKLSYDEIFKKNKKRGRSGHASLANKASGISDIQLLDGNQTMTKSMRRSVFNEPMSVRGIKSIQIEEDEKNARMLDKQDKKQEEQEVEKEEP